MIDFVMPFRFGLTHGGHKTAAYYYYYYYEVVMSIILWVLARWFSMFLQNLEQFVNADDLFVLHIDLSISLSISFYIYMSGE